MSLKFWDAISIRYVIEKRDITGKLYNVKNWVCRDASLRGMRVLGSGVKGGVSMSVERV